MSIRHLVPIVLICASLSYDAAAQSSATVPVAPSPVDGAIIEPSNEHRPQEVEPRIREEDVPADVARANTRQTSEEAQRRPVSEGAADEGTDLVLRTPDGTERMRITAAGNVGIGTAAPSTKLQVAGPLTLGKKIIGMPWTNMWSPPPGYVKLVTPIVHTESNMFQIHIVGYRYSPVGDSIDIRCSGYAYAGNYLIRTTCHTDGTDLPVEIGAETRPGGADPVVVVRIGTPTTAWYYAHFSAEYDGWVAKSAADFQWVVGETTPAQTGNLNNIIADDNTGKLIVGAAGTGPTVNRLTVNGASTFNGNVGIGTATSSGQLHVYGLPTADAIAGFGTDIGSGPVLNIGHAGSSFGRSAGFMNVRPDSLAVPPNPSLRFLTANVERMIITNLGRVGIGTLNPTTTFEVNGNANFTGTVTGGNIQAKYQDLAEWVPSRSDLSPGTVVVLDPLVTNSVVASTVAYDSTVAGVVSAQPGILLGEAGDEKEQVATTGRVRVRVDASQGAIRIGDLLVTSAKPGTAMKSHPLDLGGIPIHRPGTIIGKALEPLESGEGEILVLLSMQ